MNRFLSVDAIVQKYNWNGEFVRLTVLFCEVQAWPRATPRLCTLSRRCHLNGRGGSNEGRGSLFEAPKMWLFKPRRRLIRNRSVDGTAHVLFNWNGFEFIHLGPRAICLAETVIQNCFLASNGFYQFYRTLWHRLRLVVRDRFILETVAVLFVSLE